MVYHRSHVVADRAIQGQPTIIVRIADEDLFFEVDGPAAMAWEWLSAGIPTEDVVARMATATGQHHEVILHHVEELIQDLLTHGLLEPSPS